MNCKPGDMAVVINSLFEENIGNIVHVIRPAARCHVSRLFSWEAKSTRPCRGLDVFGGSDNSSTIGAIPDAWLRPIRPPETPVTETRDEELTV